MSETKEFRVRLYLVDLGWVRRSGMAHIWIGEVPPTYEFDVVGYMSVGKRPRFVSEIIKPVISLPAGMGSREQSQLCWALRQAIKAKLGIEVRPVWLGHVVW